MRGQQLFFGLVMLGMSLVVIYALLPVMQERISDVLPTFEPMAGGLFSFLPGVLFVVAVISIMFFIQRGGTAQ